MSPDVKFWLDRLFYMGRSAIVEISPKDATNLYATLKVLSDSKESFEKTILEVTEAHDEIKRLLATAEAEVAVLSTRSPRSRKKANK